MTTALLLSAVVLLIGSPVAHGMQLSTLVPPIPVSKTNMYQKASTMHGALLVRVVNVKAAQNALNIRFCGTFYNTSRNYTLHTERKNLEFIAKTLRVFRQLAYKYAKVQLTAAAKKQVIYVKAYTNQLLAKLLKILEVVAGHPVRINKPAVNLSWLQCQWALRYQVFLVKMGTQLILSINRG